MKFNLGKLGKALGPVIAIVLAAGVSGCDQNRHPFLCGLLKSPRS